MLESGWPRLAALHWGKTSDFQRRYSKVILPQIPEGNTATCCMTIQHAESEIHNEDLARLNRRLNAQCLIESEIHNEDLARLNRRLNAQCLIFFVF